MNGLLKGLVLFTLHIGHHLGLLHLLIALGDLSLEQCYLLVLLIDRGL